jgi:glycosyltransferase involved in cell wall biosynthesis
MQEKSGCKLTVSLLVCGREETTEKCLDSLRPLLDGIPSELILVDTGCRSKFRKKLHSYTDKIIPFTWCNDFAAARNAGLAQAQGEWFLFLDDDEWFEDVTPILDFFRSGDYRRYHQAVYRVRNYRDAEGKDYNDIWVSRMTRRDPEVHFEGKIHEYLEPVVGDSAMLDCYAHHYGYAFTSEEQKRAHANRNIPLLLEMIQSQPENMRWHEHLLIEYYTIEDFQKLRACAQNALGILSAKNDTQSNLLRGTFYTAVLMADQGERTYDRLLEDFDTFIKDRRNPEYVKCSLYKMASFAAQLNDKPDLAVQYAKLYFVSYDAYRKEKKTDQMQLLESTIIYVRDNVTEHMVNFVRAVWATSLIFAGRKEEFPEIHRRAYQEHLDRKIAAGGYEIPQYVRLIAREGLISLRGEPAEERQKETASPAADELRQKETASPAADEMQQMKKAILEKIPVLLQSGMYDDALATVRALRQILPGDAEVEAVLAQVCEAEAPS